MLRAASLLGPTAYRWAVLLCAGALGAAAAELSAQQTLELSPETLAALNVSAKRVVYRGVDAIRLAEHPGGRDTAAHTGHAIAVIPGSEFSQGTIELQVAGLPRAGADTALRGFVGLAFHVQPLGRAFRAFYLRPTNGRANDQLRRNHSTQYIAEPDYPWHRLRRESPGLYESYVDLVAGEWTRMRIVIERDRALLFVNGAEQPTLIVNDLKPGPSGGALALWIGLGTEAYFSDPVITRAGSP